MVMKYSRPKRISHTKNNIIEACALHIEARIKDIQKQKAAAKKRSDPRDPWGEETYDARINECKGLAKKLRGFKTSPPPTPPPDLLDIMKYLDDE